MGENTGTLCYMTNHVNVHSEHLVWRQASSAALAAMPLCRDSQSMRFSWMFAVIIGSLLAIFMLFNTVHFLTINMLSHSCTMRYITYDVYQLLHISAPTCYPQGVTIADVQYMSQHGSLNFTFMNPCIVIQLWK